jgi:hypothetical protein
VKLLEKVYVMQEAWDYLIVLDACRYDVMERVWDKYIKGHLTKRISLGSSTRQWRDSNFPDRYEDVVYVSANPFINSIREIRGFLGSEHFQEVYDVWRTDWDDKRGTVLPKAVSDRTIACMMMHDQARLIIHYLQPHAPYLGIASDSLGFPVPDLEAGRVLLGTSISEDPAIKIFLLNALAWFFRKTNLLGGNVNWKLREMLRMSPVSPMDAVRRVHGDAGLRAAYQTNLEIVLAAVADLIRFMSGRIIITSDHGELLGEGGRYSHFVGSERPELIEVPWLIVEKEDKEPLEAWQADRSESPDGGKQGDGDEVSRRLRALGYIE